MFPADADPSAIAAMGALFTDNIDALQIITASGGLLAAAIAILLVVRVAPRWGLSMAKKFVGLFR